MKGLPFKLGSTAFAIAILYIVLVAPNHPGAATPGALANFPFELPVIVALLFLPGVLGRGSAVVRALVVTLLLALLMLKLADFALFTSLNRPFNLAYDLPLIDAGWRLLRGTHGTTAALLMLGSAALALSTIAAMLWWAAGKISALGRDAAGSGLPPIAFVALLALVAGIFWTTGRGSAFSAQMAGRHVASALEASHDIAALRLEAADDPALSGGRSPLSALEGADVILIFVESYGRATLDNPLYAATTRAALSDIEADLIHRGYAMRSAFLTSPTAGGQSWLAHGTLLSGLDIGNQGRYQALLRTPRKSLNRIAAEAGWRSVAVMPAIVMPWPEAEWFGYDQALAAKDLGYRGKPFNWVTMPDQFTLSAFERQELTPARTRPVFAEIALISSHAPWTPVPVPVPWGDVGDGRIFDEQAAAGPSPDEVWADQDRVRNQFRLSIDYALRVVGSFAARHGDRKPVFIVLGDHQPAGFVAGTDTVRDVPVHMIGPPAVLSRISGWNWSGGMTPEASAPVWPMQDFRDRFIAAFSQPPEPKPTVRLEPS